MNGARRGIDMSELLKAIEMVVDLEKSGGYMKGVCPFCHKNGFTYSPGRDIWYCFACHRGGKQFEEFGPELFSGESVSSPLWKTIVKEFKKRIFIAKKDDNSEELKRLMSAFLVVKNILRDLNGLEMGTPFCSKTNGAAMDWFNRNLYRHGGVKEYLERFGISDYEIDELRLGYFPGGEKSIKKFIKDMQAKDISVKQLIDSKILFRGRCSLYSPLEERIIHPIFTTFDDQDGPCCGFYGFSHRDDDERMGSYSTIRLSGKNMELLDSKYLQ